MRDKTPADILHSGIGFFLQHHASNDFFQRGTFLFRLSAILCILFKMEITFLFKVNRYHPRNA